MSFLTTAPGFVPSVCTRCGATVYEHMQHKHEVWHASVETNAPRQQAVDDYLQWEDTKRQAREIHQQRQVRDAVGRSSDDRQEADL